MSRAAHAHDAAHAADAAEVTQHTQRPRTERSGDSPAAAMARRMTAVETNIVMSVGERPGSALGGDRARYARRLIAERVIVATKSPFPRTPFGFKLTAFGREVAAILNEGAQ